MIIVARGERNAVEWAMVMSLLYPSTVNRLEFPEATHPAVAARPAAALCFSGGGTRSMAACLGYYRGLVASGLLERVRYISCVSGGSWASSIFVYYRKGPSNDAALLDLGLAGSPPGELDLARLSKPLPPASMAAVMTDNLVQPIREGLERGVDGVWNHAVAKVYLEPFGLVDDEPLVPCLDAATRDHILARPGNQGVPGLSANNFILPREGRPFLVINACIIEPSEQGWIAPQRAASLQFTPLYVGSPQPVELSNPRRPKQAFAVGGGFVEPFAFGGAAPETVGADHLARIPLDPLGIDGRQTLRFAVGSSSAAYAAVADDILDNNERLTPITPYWPVRTSDLVPAQDFDVGDGGILENFGLLAMLQRRVERAVVFINTNEPLDLDYEPVHRKHPTRPTPTRGKIDPSLPTLFGIETHGIGTTRGHNTVFWIAAYRELVEALQDCKRERRPLVVHQTLDVRANAWWGIAGGWQVEIVWVYLDRVGAWEDLLPQDTQEAIEQGKRKVAGKGQLEHFPNFKTIGENPFKLVELTPTQIRASAALAEWVIAEARPLLERVLRA